MDIVVPKMASYCIAFSNLPPGTERGQVYREFVQFGEICKLYINSENGFGNVYFKLQKCAENAYNTLNSYSKLNLRLKSPVLAEVGQKLTITQSESSTSSEQNSMYQNYDDDFLAGEGPSLVDAFGNSFTTLQDDDGTIYVPIKELKRSGFKFFNVNAIPPKGTRLKNDKRIIEQFELYMKVKATKFLIQNQVQIDDNIIANTIERCKNDVFSDHRIVETNYNQSFRITSVNQDQHDRITQRDDRENYKRSQSKNCKNNQNQNQNHSQNQNHNQLRNASQHRNDSQFNKHNNDSGMQRNFNRNQQHQNDSFLHANHNKNQLVPSGHIKNHSNRNQFGKEPKPGNQSMQQFRRPRADFDNSFNKGSQNNFAQKRETNEWKGKKDKELSVNGSKEGSSNKVDPWETDGQKENKIPQKRGEKHERPGSGLSNRSHQSLKQKSKEKTVKHEEPQMVKQVELDMNAFQEVEVQHIENDTIGWVTLKQNAELLQKITMDVMGEVSEAKSIQPTIGQFCAAEFEEIWFRAVVRTTLPNLKVHFIDFGNTNTEPIKEVKPLSEKLCSIPAQAVRISLGPTPTKRLKLDAKFKIKPVAKEDNGTYVVMFEGETPPAETSTSYNKALPEDIYVDKHASFSKGNPSKGGKVRKSSTNSIISYVTPGETGLMEVKSVVNKETFVAFFTTENYLEQVCLLESIELDEDSSPSFQPLVGELAAVSYDGLLVRGKVVEIKNDKYKVALVDYGVILETKDVKPLPQTYKDFPEFTCWCKANPETLEAIKKSETINVRVLLDHKLKLTLIIPGAEEKECEVTASEWDPFKMIKVPSDKKFFSKDLPILTLCENTVVAITAENDGHLLLRTRESSAMVKQISNSMKDYKAQPYPTKSKPEIGELVLCCYADKLFRARVVGAKDEEVEIEYVDYGDYDIVPLSSLRRIEEKLATFDNTLIRAKLRGFQKFNISQLETLAKCKKNKEKFTVVQIEDGEIELRSQDGQMLSERLRQLEKSPIKREDSFSDDEDSPVKLTRQQQSPREEQEDGAKEIVVMSQDLPVYEHMPGLHDMICLSVSNIDEGFIVFCAPQPEQLLLIHKKINEHMATEPPAYSPKPLEVVLGFYEDDWYRATNVEQSKNGKYNLLFIDYGNVTTVGSEYIRKIPVELTKYCAMALFCCLEGVEEPKGKVLKRIKELIVLDESYTVEIVGKDDNKYKVRIPSVMKTLKSEGLI